MQIDILGLAASFTTFFGIYAILSLSLNLEYGFAGQPNFGKVLFYSIGGYCSGYLSTLFLLHLRGQLVDIGSSEAITLRVIAGESEPLINATAFVVSIFVGFTLAGIFGYVASFPALKLREDFLAITLLVAGEIVRVIVREQVWFSGGPQGIAGIPNPFIWIKDVKIRYLSFALLVLGFAVLTYVCINRLVNSPYGRLLKSVRDDDMASLSFGKNIPQVRGQVLAVGSGFTGIAGVLYAYYSGFVQADAFIPIITFSVWVMVILGGSANVKGSFLGALVVTVIDLVTRVFALEIQTVMGLVPFDPNYIRYIVYAALLILILMFRSRGLIPERPVKTPAWDVVKEKNPEV